MKVNLASKILKVLLIIFAVGVILFGILILPLMAYQQELYYPELSYAKWPMLITCEVLLVMLLIGIRVIMNLVTMFNQDETSSENFMKDLEILVGLCLIASAALIIIFSFLRYHGGPGPMLALLMLGVICIILIFASAIMLIRTKVKKSIEYKNNADLT